MGFIDRLKYGYTERKLQQDIPNGTTSSVKGRPMLKGQSFYKNRPRISVIVKTGANPNENSKLKDAIAARECSMKILKE
ncbi:MAG: hypothetical protein ACLR56_11845 [Oscillospiraceae bacterium]